VYRILKGVKIFISTDRKVNNEFISSYSKKKLDILDTTGHVKVTFSLLLERISKKYEGFECFLPGVGYNPTVDHINSFILNI
jgi:hypothetical protein